MITAIAALCARLLRGTTARYRHLLWVSALAFSLGLPVLTCSHLSGVAIFSEPPRTIVQQAIEDFAPAPQLIRDTEASLPVTRPTTRPTALQTDQKETVPSILINRN